MKEQTLRDLVREHTGLAAFLDRDRAWRSCVEIVTRTLGDVAWIAESNPDAPDLGTVVRHLEGDRTTVLRGLTIPPGLGLTGKVFDCGHPEWVDDYFDAPKITHTFDAHISEEGIQRLMAVPVIAEGKTLAVLAIGERADGSFGSKSIDQAKAITEEIARACQVADLARAARDSAVHAERSRVASELHDSVGALLFSIGSGMADLAAAADTDPVLRARLARLHSQATEASSALRNSMRTLRASPTALEFAIALQSDCVAFSDRTGIPAELVLLDDELTLPPGRRDIVLTAIREALLNIERHAGASGVVVTATRTHAPECLTFAITDDGCGIVDDQPRGIGLTNTADSIARLGGKLTVSGEPDSGTTWRIQLPC